MTPIRALRLASLVLLAAPLAAQAGDAGTVYTQLGVNGLGLGYAASVTPDWAVRGQFNWLPKQSYTGNVGDFGSGANLTIDLTGAPYNWWATGTPAAVVFASRAVWFLMTTRSP